MNNNYKVLLVEPNNSIVYILKNMLSWEKYQFEIVAETNNEATAIAYYGEYHHDLVICDIDLNEGDGISLIKNLKGIREDCKIIIISTHFDYESIRAAFKAGAYDYLIKSKLSHQELERLLMNLRIELDQSRQEDDWRNKLENLLGLIRDCQYINEQAVFDLLNRPELTVLNDAYQFIYFRMDNVHQVNLGLRKYENLENPRGSKDKEFSEKYKRKLEFRNELQKNTVEVVKKVFSDIPNHCLIFSKKHSGIIVVPKMERSILINKVKFLLYSMSEVSFYSYSCTISKVYSSKKDFLKAYKDVMYYHKWKFYKGDGCILDASENREFGLINQSMETYYNRICLHIIENQLEEIYQVCKEIGEYLENHVISINDSVSIFVKLFDFIEIYLADKGIYDSERFAFYKMGIKECETLVFMESEIERIFKSLVKYVREQNIQHYSKEVNHLIDYIEKNINRHLTLAMLAEVSGYSEIHTSRLFKKEVGVGIVHYINERKMMKAKEMLEMTDLKIKDVAAQVGILDQLYFNKQFNRQFSMSPSQFRKKLRADIDDNFNNKF